MSVKTDTWPKVWTFDRELYVYNTEKQWKAIKHLFIIHGTDMSIMRPIFDWWSVSTQYLPFQTFKLYTFKLLSLKFQNVETSSLKFNFALYFSWPSTSCVEPKDFLNKGPIVTIFGLESKANLENAVDQLSTHLAALNLPTVIVFGPRFKSSGVLEALENSQIKDRVSLCSILFL